MLTETRQILNLRAQDISKEIPSYLLKKNVPEFSDKFFHFQYDDITYFSIRTHTFAMYLRNFCHQYYPTNQDPKPHILS